MGSSFKVQKVVVTHEMAWGSTIHHAIFLSRFSSVLKDTERSPPLTHRKSVPSQNWLILYISNKLWKDELEQGCIRIQNLIFITNMPPFQKTIGIVRHILI